MPPPLPELLQTRREQTDEYLQELLRDGRAHERLAAAMRHIVAGGKRLRPFLVCQAAASSGLDPDHVLRTACALELLHCATLVHDDLPAIDDSDLRHGRPTAHVAYDEPTAIMAGDALILLAFECLARQADDPLTPADRALACVRELAEFTGWRGLVAGELRDIETEGHPYNEADLEFIHLNKTAKLITCATRAGGILAGADAATLGWLTDYGEALGLLFQITDDLLDVVGVEAETGKPVGADAAAGKATYPGLLGLEAARQRAAEVAGRALAAADALPDSEVWRSLVEFVVARRH